MSEERSHHTAENSEYCDMTQEELNEVKEKASACLD